MSRGPIVQKSKQQEASVLDSDGPRASASLAKKSAKAKGKSKIDSEDEAEHDSDMDGFKPKNKAKKSSVKGSESDTDEEVVEKKKSKSSKKQTKSKSKSDSEDEAENESEMDTDDEADEKASKKQKPKRVRVYSEKFRALDQARKNAFRPTYVLPAWEHLLVKEEFKADYVKEFTKVRKDIKDGKVKTDPVALAARKSVRTFMETYEDGVDPVPTEKDERFLKIKENKAYEGRFEFYVEQWIGYFEDRLEELEEKYNGKEGAREKAFNEKIKIKVKRFLEYGGLRFDEKTAKFKDKRPEVLAAVKERVNAIRREISEDDDIADGTLAGLFWAKKISTAKKTITLPKTMVKHTLIPTINFGMHLPRPTQKLWKTWPTKKAKKRKEKTEEVLRAEHNARDNAKLPGHQLESDAEIEAKYKTPEARKAYKETQISIQSKSCKR